VPTAPHLELHAGGLDEEVTAANVHRYVAEACDWVLRIGISAQLAAFTQGFAAVAPAALDRLRMLTVKEQQRLLSGDSDVLWEPACRLERCPDKRCARPPSTNTPLSPCARHLAFELSVPNVARGGSSFSHLLPQWGTDTNVRTGAVFPQACGGGGGAAHAAGAQARVYARLGPATAAVQSAR